ncbi:YdbH domain-containing protein [Shewanella sp. GXUN23E]|uniref:YdbH domain-containing protein n=1 Tax=Shewanella sp. GXUN23E TaxID=3422498 RepID=UPI003D7CBBE7
MNGKRWLWGLGTTLLLSLLLLVLCRQWLVNTLANHFLAPYQLQLKSLDYSITDLRSVTIHRLLLSHQQNTLTLEQVDINLGVPFYRINRTNIAAIHVQAQELLLTLPQLPFIPSAPQQPSTDHSQAFPIPGDWVTLLPHLDIARARLNLAGVLLDIDKAALAALSSAKANHPESQGIRFSARLVQAGAVSKTAPHNQPALATLSGQWTRSQLTLDIGLELSPLPALAADLDNAQDNSWRNAQDAQTKTVTASGAPSPIPNDPSMRAIKALARVTLTGQAQVKMQLSPDEGLNARGELSKVTVAGELSDILASPFTLIPADVSAVHSQSQGFKISTDLLAFGFTQREQHSRLLKLQPAILTLNIDNLPALLADRLIPTHSVTASPAAAAESAMATDTDTESGTGTTTETVAGSVTGPGLATDNAAEPVRNKQPQSLRSVLAIPELSLQSPLTISWHSTLTLAIHSTPAASHDPDAKSQTEQQQTQQSVQMPHPDAQDRAASALKQTFEPGQVTATERELSAGTTGALTITLGPQSLILTQPALSCRASCALTAAYQLTLKHQALDGSRLQSYVPVAAHWQLGQGTITASGRIAADFPVNKQDSAQAATKGNELPLAETLQAKINGELDWSPAWLKHGAEFYTQEPQLKLGTEIEWDKGLIRVQQTSLNLKLPSLRLDQPQGYLDAAFNTALSIDSLIIDPRLNDSRLNDSARVDSHSGIDSHRGAATADDTQIADSKSRESRLPFTVQTAAPIKLSMELNDASAELNRRHWTLPPVSLKQTLNWSLTADSAVKTVNSSANQTWLTSDERWQWGDISATSQHRLTGSKDARWQLQGQWQTFALLPTLQQTLASAVPPKLWRQYYPQELTLKGSVQLQASTQLDVTLPGRHKLSPVANWQIDLHPEFNLPSAKWQQIIFEQGKFSGHCRAGAQFADVRCDDLLLTLGNFNPGLPITDIHLAGHINAEVSGGGELNIQGRGKVLDGEFLLPEFILSKHSVSSAYLVLQGLSLPKLLALQPLEGVTLTGIFDGVLPAKIDHGKVSVSGGRLAARAPGGQIAITDNPTITHLRQTQPQLDFAFNVLTDLHYSSLYSTFDMQPTGEAELKVHIEGNSPGITRPIEFNYTHQENLLQLLQSLQIGNTLQQRLQDSLE